jgi:putative nucleotidyltransferase with HDIG domain
MIGKNISYSVAVLHAGTFMPDTAEKRITIGELEVGMFVQDVFNARDVLVISANSMIWDQSQIESLKLQGVRTLYINTQKGKDVSEVLPPVKTETDSQQDPLKREEEYYKELERAKVVHRQTLETAREVLDAIKNGNSFSMDKVEKAAEGVVESILRNPDTLISLSQIKGYDEYTYTHSVGVSVLVASLANSMGYKGDHLLEAGVGGLLHDIGKMRVPESILNKPGKYTEWEFKVMKKHPEHGMDILKDKKKVSDFAKAVIIQHHERYNGKGYPYGLTGDKIEEVGLMAAVADVYDALTSNRIYRAAWPPQKALALIFKGADDEYSRKIVERFTKHLGIYPAGSFVKLVSGAMGVVSRVDRGNLLAPTVVLIFDESGRRLEKPYECDLASLQKGPEGKKYHVEISLNPKAYRVDVGQYLSENPLE